MPHINNKPTSQKERQKKKTINLIYKHTHCKKLLKDCLDNKLFANDGGLLKQTMELRLKLNSRKSTKMIVAYQTNQTDQDNLPSKIKKTKPIGVILIINNAIQIFVSPKYRGYGIANKLMETLIKIHKIDISKLIAWAPLNKSGRCFYENHGIPYKGTGLAFYEDLGWTVAIPDKKEKLTSIRSDYKTKILRFR